MRIFLIIAVFLGLCSQSNAQRVYFEESNPFAYYLGLTNSPATSPVLYADNVARSYLTAWTSDVVFVRVAIRSLAGSYGQYCYINNKYGRRAAVCWAKPDSGSEYNTYTFPVSLSNGYINYQCSTGVTVLLS